MAFSEPPTSSSSPMSTILSTAITTIKDTVFVTTFETELINATLTDAPVPYYINILKSVQKWLITAILVFIMLAMGAVISLEDFKQTFRHPVGFLVGFASQFITMPLICFVFALVLKLEPPFALGLLIIGCCPGGTVSNLFTFWTDGDICLSVCMTTVSCIAAIGMMPLNLFIYSRRWTTEQTKIPFINIFTTLVTIIVPAVAGMIIRRFSVRWAGRVSQAGGVAGLSCIPVVIILMGVINPRMFLSSWKIWFSTFFLPFLGYFFGYGSARLFKQPNAKCRTIGFETGIQNSALGVTIMLLSFNDSTLLYDMMTIPSFYGILSFADFLIYVFVFHGIKYCRNRENNKHEGMDEVGGVDFQVKSVDANTTEMTIGRGKKYLQINSPPADDVEMAVHSADDYQPLEMTEISR
ncbi:ileal sodium/bile acid cotransporter-like [Diadema setosum]|uniref:ileal sodium/bile acid cotransporter-like n=1 Tax=Diadema setosum TaxID=31175 RepID=UPI003B3A9144